MICRFTASIACLIKTAFGRDIQFTADDRFDSVLIGMLIKIDRPVEIAVIGHRNGRHLIFFCLLEKVIEANRTVEEAVLGVKVKMNEIGMFHRLSIQPVVRRFFGDNDIMNMTFPESRGGNLDKTRLLS